MQRRQLLSGLGIGLASAGIIGTGAFRQVTATRNVSVTTSDDSSANLAITGPTDETTTNDGVVEIDLSKVNKEAVTTFDNILEFNYNGGRDLSGTASGDNQLELSIKDSESFPNSAVDFYQHDTTTSVVGNTWTIQDTSGLPAALDMEVDTTGSNDPTTLSEVKIDTKITQI